MGKWTAPRAGVHRIPMSPKRWSAWPAVLLALTAACGETVAGQEASLPRVAIGLATGESIVLELFAADAPDTVDNFLNLVRDRFYDGLVFHRVEDWVVQTGCPEGDGSGGPPWTITLELSGHPNVRGAVGMARVGDDPHSAGSQFYILKKDAPHLDGQYAVFGQVVSGMEAVDGMVQGAAITSIRVEDALGANPEGTASLRGGAVPSAVETQSRTSLPIGSSLLRGGMSTLWEDLTKALDGGTGLEGLLARNGWVALTG